MLQTIVADHGLDACHLHHRDRTRHHQCVFSQFATGAANMEELAAQIHKRDTGRNGNMVGIKYVSLFCLTFVYIL